MLEVYWLQNLNKILLCSACLRLDFGQLSNVAPNMPMIIRQDCFGLLILLGLGFLLPSPENFSDDSLHYYVSKTPKPNLLL